MKYLQLQFLTDRIMSKKKKKKHTGKYYFQGDATKKIREMICEMVEEGINVYHQFGKPGTGCPPGGCH